MRVDCISQEDFSGSFEVIFEKEIGESKEEEEHTEGAELCVCAGSNTWAGVARQVSVYQGSIAQN